MSKFEPGTLADVFTDEHEALVELVSTLQAQNKELKLELKRGRKKHLELEDKCTELRGTIGELHKQVKELEENIGEDIELFYDKAKRVIESQFGLGITMRPGDLIKLWFHFLHIARQFQGMGMNERAVYRMEQAAMGLAQQMYERGEIQTPQDTLGTMLERIVYPYITISVGTEVLTWKEMRDKYR